MRSTKLLAALAGTALIAACTQEELVKVENAPQTMEEVVGTKLIGTDVSLNVTNDAQTRLVINGGAAVWEKSDIIGVGWVAYGNPLNDDQASEDENGQITPNEPNGHALYANHMFNWNEEADRFTSKGNFYQGWHFAYYPWERMTKVGQKVFTVNPNQGKCEEGQDVRSLRASQALQISQRHFVDAVNEDNTLEVAFAVQPTTNMISVNTTPVSSAFIKDGDKAGQLADKKISKVIIRINGENAFAEELKLNAANIPAWSTDEKVDNKKVLREKLYATDSPILDVVGERLDTVDTDVTAAGYLVSDATHLNTIVAPYSWDVDWTTDEGKNAAREKVAIEVVLENDSYFDIKYVTDAVENSPASVNNAAIDKLIQAYASIEAKDWNANALFGVFKYANGSQVNLDVQLYDAIFNTDATFNNIKDLKTWNDAVDMVEWLKRPAQEFIITGNVEFENGIIPMPENGCVVTAKCAEYDNRFKQIFTLKQGEYNEWPATLKSRIYVTVAENAIFNAAHLMNDKTVQIVNKGTINVPAGTAEAHNSIATGAYAVENYGVINVAPYGEIGDVKNHNRIVVEYGAFVYPRDGFTGTIAYNVIDKDVKDPSRIVKLTALETTDTQKRLASVNTLIINKEIQGLDFTKTTIGDGTESDNDPYAPTVGEDGEPSTVDFGDLAKVNFEINGGSITSSTEEVVINNVQMNDGEISGLIKIAGALTLESGVNTVNATDIEGALNIEDGSGTITSAASIASVNIEAGNYTINAQTINAQTVNANEEGVAIDATGENYFNVKTINGDVEINNTSSNATHIDGATINGNVTLNGDIALNNVIVKGNLIVEDGTVKMDASNIIGTLEVKAGAEVVVAGNDTHVDNIENYGSLTTSVDIYTETVAVYSGATANVAAGKTIWYTKPNAGQHGYIQEGTTIGRILYHQVDAETADAIKDAFGMPVATINLKNDVTADFLEITTAESNVTLNGAGHTLTSGTPTDYSLIVKNGSSLEINDLNINSNGGGIGATNGAKVTFNGGSLALNAATTNPRYNFYVVENSSVTINEGTFSIDRLTLKRAYIYADAGATVYVNGGTFGKASTRSGYTAGILGDGKVIITGGTFGFDPSAWVADGYQAVENGEVWTVSAI